MPDQRTPPPLVKPFDPADLNTFGPTTTADMLAEAMRLGIPFDRMTEPANLDALTLSRMVTTRAQNVRAICELQKILVSNEQARTIAKNTLVGRDHFPKGVPLSPEERAIAQQVLFQSFLAYVKRHGGNVTKELSANLWRDAERSVHFGERGPTVLHKIGDASGCLLILLAPTTLFAISGWIVILLRNMT